MTLQEQQVFEETRNRIQRNLSEISALARTNTPLKGFFSRFLDLACDCLNARGGAVWMIESGAWSPVARRAFDSAGYEADPLQKKWIDSVVAITVSAKRPHVVAADDPSQGPREIPEGGVGNAVPHPFFYHPVMLGEQCGAVLQIWLPQAGDPSTYGEISTFLSQLCGHAETYLRGWQGAQLAARNDQAQTMLRMQSEFVGELDPKVLHGSAANYLVDLMRADLACVFRKKGRKWVLSAASNQETVDARTVKAQALSRVAEGLAPALQGAVQEVSSAEEGLRENMEKAGVQRVVWIHLSSSKNAPPDVLLLAAKNEEGLFPANAQELIVWAGGQFSRALDAATHFHHIPLRPLVSGAGRITRAWVQNRRRKVLAFVVAPLVFLAALAVVPVPWKISAECTVVPARKALVVAETSGKIVKVAVSEGDIVKTGQLLASLEDTDYLTQLAVSKQQLLRWQVEAGKAQSLGNEAERKIAELGAAREVEAIRRIEYLRSRTELRSPLDGMVLTRNLQNRQGEALEVGKPFCEIGCLNDYQLQMDIKQNDLGDLLNALDGGRRLPVDFILHSHPKTPLTATLEGTGNVSQIPELKKTGSLFIATAPFPSNSPLEDVLKPGFTGKAKIQMGRRPLGWVLFRPFLNYIRVNWGL